MQISFPEGGAGYGEPEEIKGLLESRRDSPESLPRILGSRPTSCQHLRFTPAASGERVKQTRPEAHLKQQRSKALSGRFSAYADKVKLFRAGRHGPRMPESGSTAERRIARRVGGGGTRAVHQGSSAFFRR
ncbi:hypothetical protein AAFF_G00105010 [Aldrovandia affinis]|uniref:Uncharacterized protein n=1 Tax=Aldrovandia affinis TaxID=143900 RepID=A0AAD7WYJ3_9TELE|nr:hypothetical protein AAFF_G00105010 [Aldrovandia affinis]